MAVTADNRHPRQCDAEFGADDVDNALLGRVHIKEWDAKLAAILLQRLNLLRRNHIRDRKPARRSRNIVVDRSHGSLRMPDAPLCSPQPIKGLRRGDLVD